MSIIVSILMLNKQYKVMNKFDITLYIFYPFDSYFNPKCPVNKKSR